MFLALNEIIAEYSPYKNIYIYRDINIYICVFNIELCNCYTLYLEYLTNYLC